MKAFLWKLLKLTAACIWFIAVSFPIMMYFERAPVTVYTDRSITPAKVYPGDEITVNISAGMSKDCSAIVYRTIHDSTGRVFSFDPEPRPKRQSYPVKKIVPRPS